MSARAVAVALLLLATGALGCRSPTEVTLRLTTDVPCADFSGAAIAVGVAGDVETKAPATTTTMCTADGTVGSLVIVPSGSDDDEIVIRIAGGVDRDPETCGDTGDASGCIVSRRAVRFIEHTPLVLDVPLRSACNGVVCALDQTCVAGVCASDVVPESCGASPGGCGEDLLAGADASAAPPVRDGGAAGDATPDATLRDTGASPVADAASEAGDSSRVPPSPCADGSEPGAIWPSTRYCGTFSARSPFVGPSRSAVSSGFAMGDGTFAALAVAADGTLFVGSDEGAVYALDGNNLGSLYTAGCGTGAVLSAVVASASVLFVTTAAGLCKVSRVGATTPTTTSDTGGANAPAAVLEASGDAVTSLFNGTTTALVGFGATFPMAADWSFNGGYAASPLSIASGPGGSIFTTWDKSPVFTLTSFGTLTATSKTSYAGSLVVGPEHVYDWSTSSVSVVDGATVQIPAILGVALVSTGLVVLSTSPGGGALLTRLDPDTLTTNGAAQTVSGTPSSPPVVDASDTVYFITSDGTLHQTFADGTDVPHAGAPPGAVTSAPILGNGVAYIGGGGGTVMAYK